MSAVLTGKSLEHNLYDSSDATPLKVFQDMTVLKCNMANTSYQRHMANVDFQRAVQNFFRSQDASDTAN